MWWKKIKNEIINTDLFSCSGTIVGLSKGILKFKENQGNYKIEKISDDDVPEVAYSACCDRYLNYPLLNKEVFGKLPKNWLIGNYKKIYVGHYNNKNIRKNASSGGVITGIQKYLFENNKINGAITTKMRKDKPYLAKPIIANSIDDIISGAQSKYTVTPINQILAELPGKYKSLSYTGLPEQIAAIRKLQIINHETVKNINYILGIFHGNTIKFNAIKSFLKAHGIKNLDQIKSLKFRDGEWPGHMKIDLINNKIISIPKFYANYLIPSHITKYSFYQVDYMSELADISVGDAWAPVYEKRGEGWSVIISRNNKGESLLNEIKNKELLSLNEISEDELIKMHSHGLDFKKRGSFIRIAKRKKDGLPAPDYGYKPTNIPAGRKRFELLLIILFKIFRSKVIIYLLEIIPPAITGKIFIQARNIWKKRTKSTKKNNIKNLKFKITSYEK
ncbi:Coenzyme F420 hydrogenase/dehydrogenase, beta subunit C-terminal domain [Candidatus Parcubacteria bacterium]|nr:Coenzyme F420 hydrogenase/dehydrogenase, beta subunit C-terminal domain [Candidatus Parcubacteria bacterium]